MPLPADAPRRSSRRPKPKNYSSYKVGDVVEITRHNVSAIGRLAYKLSEGPTPNPRWLVTFDGQSWKDEELYERSFGKIVEKAEDAVAPKSSNARRGKGSNSPKSSKNSGPSSSEDDEQSGSKIKRKVAFSEDSVVGSDESPSPSNGGDDAARAKVSAREQRSRRRQAKIHEEVGEMTSLDDRKRGRVGSTNSGSNASIKRSRKSEEVVKIPMLTGTLYLYRGLERRAEFVRKY